MKKFLGFIAAVAMVAAGIAPAMAADVELSGEVRVRHEVASAYSFVDGDSRNATSQRTRLNAKVAVDDQTTAFISLADVRNWGDDFDSSNPDGNPATHTASDEGVHLNEGWLQMNDVLGPVGVKIGRQRLSFGKQRVLGALEWTDGGNRWDALSLLYGNDTVKAQLFFANKSETQTQDDNLNGIYVTISDVVPANTLDVYTIQKTGDNNQDFLTSGVRLAGKAAGLDWDVEYALQNGDMNLTQDAGASMYVAELGYSLPDTMGLRLGAQIFMGEGAEGGDAGWDNLYPTNHFKYGIADKEGGLAGKNGDGLEGMGVSVSLKPVDGVTVKAEYLMFEGETSGLDMGTEMNVGVKFSMTEKVKVYAYAASFDPDEEYVAVWGGNEEYEKVGIMVGAKF